MATCPFIASAVATDQLQVLNTAERPLARIEDVARLGDTGGGDLGTRVLKLFARGNHSRWIVPVEAGTGEDQDRGGGGAPRSDRPDARGEQVPNGTFSLHFGGSQGAHSGHSGILLGDPGDIGRGRLDRAAFERLAARADRDGRLSIDAVGDFIADNLKRDPDARVLPLTRLLGDFVRLLGEFKDVVLRRTEPERTEAVAALTRLLGSDHLAASAGEWGLLFAFLENSPNSDDGDIALSDVSGMFVDKRLPAGWETWEKSALTWVKSTLRLAKDAALAYHIGRE
jgi:hypothetical protein